MNKTLAFILIIISILLSVVGCQKNDASEAQQIIDKAINSLGGEQKASTAILQSADLGYSLKQIIDGIQNEKIKENGKIEGVKPDRKVQKYLISAKLLLLAANDTGFLLADINKGDVKNIDEVIENHKAAWTTWMFGVIEKGYSVEQITMFMLENNQPAIVWLPPIGPVITETTKDDSGQEIVIILSPKFESQGSMFDINEVDGADEFISSSKKDFKDLIGTEVKKKNNSKVSKTNKKSKSKGSAKKFKAAVIKPKLDGTMGGSDIPVSQFDATIRIDDKGNVTGDYEIVSIKKEIVTTTKREETATLSGKARIVNNDKSKILLQITGQRKTKVTNTNNGRSNSYITDIKIRNLFQGSISDDASEGSGFLYSDIGIFKWKI